MTPMAQHLAPVTSVQGRITDLLGSPIPGAKIEISTGGDAQRFSASSDAQGNYKIDNLPATRLKISVGYRGFQQEEFTIFPKIGKHIFDVGLQVGNLFDIPTTKILGAVKRSDNVPIPDATITVTSAFNQRVVERVRTNADGRYEINIEHPGQYIIHASKPGFMVSATTIVLTTTLPREQRTADFMLSSFR
jgi:hypothetical protein